MKFSLGIKSDPILHRYSFDWLFRFMQRNGLHHIQLGSFVELYSVDLEYFCDLKRCAEEHDVCISSCFTSHRELGGFFTGNNYLENTAAKNYRRYIDVATVLGADYVGSNAGAVLRDQPESKSAGITCYLEHMKGLMRYACEKGVVGLTIEPMSSTMEPPSLPEEIQHMMDTLGEYHEAHGDTVPVYLCGDTAHGVRDQRGNLLADSESLFTSNIPYMCEFHIKNTDHMYNATFGFSIDDPDRGIVSLERLSDTIYENEARWPVDHVVGYLEINGPKLGRDYLDCLLEEQLQESIDALTAVFLRDQQATV